MSFAIYHQLPTAAPDPFCTISVSEEEVTATLLQETGLLLLLRVASVMLRSRYSLGQLNSLKLNEMYTTSWLAAIRQKNSSAEGKRDMKEKHIFFQSRGETPSNPVLTNIRLRLASQIYVASVFFDPGNFSAIIFFLSGLIAITVCREAGIGKQSLCCHCASDFLSFAVRPPDVSTFVEV